MNSDTIDIVQFLKIIIEALKDSGVGYLIGGAIAEWAWGEPRSTQDIDLVVNIPLEAINKLSAELKKRGMLVPADIILNSMVENRSDIPINAIHMFSGLKADLYPIRSGDLLRAEAFNRRQEVDFGPDIGKVFVHSPEDLIIYKLRYFSISQQTKHSRDITAIMRSRRGQLDFGYINKWVDYFGLTAIWSELIENIDRGT